MANKILVQEMDGTPEQICFRDVTDFSPAAAKDLRVSSPTLVQLDLTGVTDGAYRQSTKGYFGANRALSYAVQAALEFAATPTAADAVYIHFAFSSSSTAANANPGGVSGADSAYAGYNSNPEEGVRQLKPTVVFVCTDDPTAYVQVAECGVIYPTQAYVSLVIQNESGAAFHSDAVEIHIVLNPIVPEVQ